MNGLMMQQPLLVSTLLTHAERHHGSQQIVSRRVEGDVHSLHVSRTRGTCPQHGQRALGSRHQVWRPRGHIGLERLPAHGTLLRGLRLGCGAAHLNPRLHPDQVVWIAENAEDQVIFFDLTFLPLIETIAARLTTVKAFVATTDRAHMPASDKVP